MTNVTVQYRELLDLVGTEMPIDELVNTIMMMGSGHEATEGEALTFDIFPSRPDMYSVEGIARSLRGYLGLETGLPSFPTSKSGVQFVVDKSVEAVRPHAVGGIVRDVELSDESVASLVDLQEKLHLTLGRRRRKVAIGIHDLDKVKPPFTYKAVYPNSVRFIPLGMAEVMTLAEILERHEKGREFGPIVAEKPLYPVITDTDGVVLSFPPVINGIATQLTPETKNLFIDVTGTDAAAVRSALTILCASLAERKARIETVTTAYPDRSFETPSFETKIRIVDLDRANRLLGLSVSPAHAIELLRRMRYDGHPQGTKIAVEVPAYRTDVIHDWDVYEDLGIAYGFDKIPLTLPRAQTIGDPARAAEFGNALRTLMVGYGYLEVMTLATTAPKGPVEGPKPVGIVNPVSEDFSALRASLLPGILNTLRLNKHRDLPQRVFEVGDVVVGGRNVARVAGASIHPKASFTEMKSLVLSLVRDVGRSCEVEPVEDANFIPGRCAGVVVDLDRVGVFGEVHPRVIDGMELAHPVAAFEVDTEPLR